MKTLLSNAELQLREAEKAETPNKLTPKTPVAYDLGLVN